MTKEEKFAENRRKAAIANKHYNRMVKLEKNYHNSKKAKRLRKAVEEAIDRINDLVYEWNDIVMSREEK